MNNLLKINNASEITYDWLKSNLDIKTIIWKYMRNKISDNEKKYIDQNIDRKKLEDIIKIIKVENKDYYALSIFRNSEDINKSRMLLTNMYSKGIVVNDFKNLKKEVKISESNLIDILNVLDDITSFCIKNNRSGSEVVDILNENFDIDLSICRDIGNIYDSNKISLKLNYIINELELLSNN
ncbi:MAG: hypothetical protein ACI35S_04795 [Anaeroplasma sp.]